MKLRVYISLFFTLFLFACNKKDYPKDSIENGDATFFSELLVNGSALRLEAGKNGYYMYSSYRQDSNGVYGFIGELKNAAGNSTGSNSLKIQFNDSKISAPNAASNVIASLVAGSYQFYDATYTTSYGVEFESTYNKNAKTYFWDFGDGNTSNEVNPIHYFKKAGQLTSCLNIEGLNSCNSSACQQITLGNNSFNAYINSTGVSDSSFIFSATTLGGKAPFTYLWSFGDGVTSQLPSPKHKYSIGGSYPVKLRLRDADSKTLELSYNVVTASDKSSCASNIKIKSILPSTINYGLSEVLVSYTDANGKTFSSFVNAQTNNSTFKVVSVEDFDANEHGEKTKKIRVKFTCTLYSGTENITLEGTDCIICVAYK